MTTDQPVRTIPLPESPKDVPSVSLHVIAKNAENVIGRLLDNVGHFVQEVRIVLNDTTDDSERVVRDRLARLPGVQLHIQHVTSGSHPKFYFLDTAETYQMGSALDGERVCDPTFEGPFTEAPLLGDWAGLRNLGWGSDSAWRLFLDADDIVDDPHKLPGLLTVLSGMRADLAATKYAIGKGSSKTVVYRERLARNTPNIRWEGKTHEVLVGDLRRVAVEDCFSVTDVKDNAGCGVRVPGRCFKVLYREARRESWRVPPRHLAYLIQESSGMMPFSWVTRSLLPAYVAASVQPEERAWVLSMVGERYEALGELVEASLCYAEAVAVYPSSKAAFRWCRVFFLQENWSDCVTAYELGVKFIREPQVLDLGPVYADSSKLLAAEAYFQLGKIDEARTMIDDVSKLYPKSAAVASFRNRIFGRDRG